VTDRVQTLNPRPEWSTAKTIAQACLLADSLGVVVHFVYNGESFSVEPGADNAELLAAVRDAKRTVARFDF